MTPPRWLFWHRRDLRLADNLCLADLAAVTPAVTGVFVLDPAILSDPAMAPARLWFLRESLLELQQRWRQAGSRLLLLQGDPGELLPRLATALGAEGVAWNRDVEPYGRARDRRVQAALKASGLRLQADWDQLLVPPELLKTGGGDPYRVYGPYLRSWRKALAARPAAELLPRPAPSGLLDIDPEALPEERAALWQAWSGFLQRRISARASQEPRCAPAGPARQRRWSSCRPSARAAPARAVPVAAASRCSPMNRAAICPGRRSPPA